MFSYVEWINEWFSSKLDIKCFPCSSVGKESARVRSLGWEDPLEKEMATHSSILAWKIWWTEEPGGLQSIGSQSRARLSDEHLLRHELNSLTGLHETSFPLPASLTLSLHSSPPTPPHCPHLPRTHAQQFPVSMLLHCSVNSFYYLCANAPISIKYSVNITLWNCSWCA